MHWSGAHWKVMPSLLHGGGFVQPFSIPDMIKSNRVKILLIAFLPVAVDTTISSGDKHREETAGALLYLK